MPAIAIRPGIYWIGVNDRTTDLFEGVWPIAHEGVSYNSYLIMDQKKVLVDLAKDAQGDSFLRQIYDLLNPTELDYIVLNHMEPDHTGAIKLLRHLAPQATFLVSEKAKGMLESFYGITERVRVVGDGEELSLGNRSLQFFAVPFVHWPETMVTFDKSQRVLFACDAFGGYGALHGAIFDDECADLDFYIRESLRYYVNIVARFSRPVLRAIDKLQGLEIDVIAPSHGLIWRGNPSQIVQLYQKWATYATQPGEPGITMVYGSMYGNTELMMNALAEGISKVGIPLDIFDAARTHSSYILPSMWTRSGVVVGAPTYEGSLFPPVAQMLGTAAHKQIRNKKALYFGSYAWSGGAKRACEELAAKLQWEWSDSLEFIGSPTKQDLHRGEDIGERFARLVAQV